MTTALSKPAATALNSGSHDNQLGAGISPAVLCPFDQESIFIIAPFLEPAAKKYKLTSNNLPLS